MRMLGVVGALVVCAGSVSAQTELLIASYPDRATAGLGDTVTWTIVAELLNPDPTKTIHATVSDISFDLSHRGDTGIQIVNNSFQPAFDSDFFGPANPGVVSGDSIVGAAGSNTISPLNNPGGPDSSNPISIYTYQTIITDDSPRQVIADIGIIGQFGGAYEGAPFPEVFQYQDALGNPGDIPFVFPVLLNYPHVQIVPAPMSASLLVLAGAGAVRRRR